MPRKDGSTPRQKARRHHKKMASASKGKGHDSKLRFAKRRVAEACGHCGKPVDKKRKTLENQHEYEPA